MTMIQYKSINYSVIDENKKTVRVGNYEITGIRPSAVPKTYSESLKIPRFVYNNHVKQVHAIIAPFLQYLFLVLLLPYEKALLIGAQRLFPWFLLAKASLK